MLGTTNVGTLAERSRLPLLTSLANLHLSCKYVGASPREIWYISTASLKSIRWLTGNQIELLYLKTGVVCSRLPIAVDFRLSSKTFEAEPHTCPCSKQEDAKGLHGLACHRSSARQQRNSQVNDIMESDQESYNTIRK